MRIASFALTIAAIALAVGLVAQPPDRASADYNITGEWTFYADGEAPCPADIVETKEGVLSEVIIEITFHCDPPSSMCGDGCVVSGALNRTNGFFQLVAEPFTSITVLSGTISGGSHTIEGNFLNYCLLGCIPPPGFRSLVPYTATGGNGDPKLGTATPSPLTPTPPPVGGVAFDTQNGGSMIDAWWLTAIASAAFVMLGGALYARRKSAR